MLVFYRKNVHGHVRVLSEVDKKVISSIKDKPSLTIKELAVICSKSEKTISRSLLKMKALGIVERIGSDKQGIWNVKEGKLI